MTTPQQLILRGLASAACSGGGNNGEEEEAEGKTERERRDCKGGGWRKTLSWGEMRFCLGLLCMVALIAGLAIFNSVDQNIKNRYFELALQKLNASLCENRQRRDCDDNYDPQTSDKDSDGGGDDGNTNETTEI